MKKRTKVVLGISIPLVLIIGGITMTQMKTPFDIFLIKDFTAQSKENTKQMQIDYLKKHEKEMTTFVMNQNQNQSPDHQIRSVQWDWKSVEVHDDKTMFGTDIYLTVEGKFNEIQSSSFALDFTLDNANDIPSMKAVDLSQAFTIDGGQKGYE
ncbi:hypothetical protein ACFO26_05975 [Lactococcus nasutitermitis]|uniref:Lipoprotein n=1 Tax=Lactococcus nasutitermitis TaxID=1652957 RepID=A0ABV9JDC6_9LACT|nr:hypothetical protein [Lactococcus nasutitermitis]